MQKIPQTFAQKFNHFFTTRRLLTIIGILFGVIAARVLERLLGA
jgi:hypothetical protein